MLPIEMDTSELIRQVRKIEIKTKGLSNNIFAGQYHSAFKGRGMAFSEVREYQYGDDARDMEWNVTARMHKPYVKVYEEERELTVMLLVDLSNSLHYGTSHCQKREMVTEIAATIAFAAIQNNDKVGLLLFTDKIEKYIPPQKGKKHILYLIRELLYFSPQSKKTDISIPLEFLISGVRKRCTAFLLSDFIYDKDFSNALTIAGKKHDLVAIQVYDKRSEELPNVGLLKVQDLESGEDILIDTSRSSIRSAHREYWIQNQERLNNCFTKSNIDSAKIRTDQDYVKSLMALFSNRR